MKALFIPLKTEFFEAFRDGTKDTEFRPYGPRWNERTCAIGRPVVLSKGYGKAHRLIARIVEFTTSEEPTKTEAWRECYGDKEGLVACIKVARETEGS
jgi:hypothetical protein